MLYLKTYIQNPCTAETSIIIIYHTSATYFGHEQVS